MQQHASFSSTLSRLPVLNRKIGGTESIAHYQLYKSTHDGQARSDMKRIYHQCTSKQCPAYMNNTVNVSREPFSRFVQHDDTRWNVWTIDDSLKRIGSTDVPVTNHWGEWEKWNVY